HRLRGEGGVARVAGQGEVHFGGAAAEGGRRLEVAADQARDLGRRLGVGPPRQGTVLLRGRRSPQRGGALEVVAQFVEDVLPGVALVRDQVLQDGDRHGGR